MQYLNLHRYDQPGKFKLSITFSELDLCSNCLYRVNTSRSMWYIGFEFLNTGNASKAYFLGNCWDVTVEFFQILPIGGGNLGFSVFFISRIQRHKSNSAIAPHPCSEKCFIVKKKLALYFSRKYSTTSGICINRPELKSAEVDLIFGA